MYYKKINNERGVSHLILLGALVLIFVVSGVGFRVYSSANRTSKLTPSSTTEEKKQVESAPQLPHSAPPETKNPLPKSSAPTPKSTPVPFTTSIQIKGDSSCQSSTLNALKLLSGSAAAHYAAVAKYISVIECASQGSGMYAYENPPRYLVGDATRNAGTVWYAGTVAHDAGHSKLYHDYLTSHPGESVPDNVWTGEGAERNCLEAQYNALTQIGGTQHQLDYVQNVINTQYYDVPPDQRWW